MARRAYSSKKSLKRGRETGRPAMTDETMPRRTFLKVGAVGATGLLAADTVIAGPRGDDPKMPRRPTQFQIACMTLPYSPFPLQRALTGLRNVGYRFVAWGTSHREEGKNVPILASDAPVAAARDLASRCRDLGLEPVMMFSTIYP